MESSEDLRGVSRNNRVLVSQFVGTACLSYVGAVVTVTQELSDALFQVGCLLAQPLVFLPQQEAFGGVGARTGAIGCRVSSRGY